MNDKLLMINIVAAFGSLSLLAATYMLTTKLNEKVSLTLNLFGAFLMATSFYLAGSWPFLVLNILWSAFTLIGLSQRSTKDNDKNITSVIVQKQSYRIGLLLLPAFSVFMQDEISAWVSISMMIVSYCLFCYRYISKHDYLLILLSANIISLKHLFVIGNFTSLTQTLVSIGITIAGISIFIKRNKQAQFE